MGEIDKGLGALLATSKQHHVLRPKGGEGGDELQVCKPLKPPGILTRFKASLSRFEFLL